jgi:Glycosyltransferase family 87
MKINFRNYKANFILIAFFITGFIATYFSQLIVGKLLGSTSGLIFLIILFLFCYLKLKTSSKYFRAIETGSIITGIYIGLRFIIQIVKSNILHSGEWDFLCFFMDGHVAANGLNFYNPQNYATVLSNVSLPFIPSKDFIIETINVGFQYFPPNIFNFLFLGYFNFENAHILWIILNAICFSICIFLVWKLYLKEDKVLGLIFTVGLFLLLPGSHTAVRFEHNTFIFMLPILLAWKYREKPSSGIWLTIGFCLKPLLAILFIYPVLRRKWKTLLYSISSLIIISLATIAVFGTDTFFSFFTENPVAKNFPDFLYTEWVNQSLLATILRLTSFDFTAGSPLLHPLFILIGGIISISTFYLAYKLHKEDSDLALALILISALLLYPGSINSYSPLIIPIIGLFISYTNSNKIDLWLTFIIISFIYSTMFFNPFISHFIVWIVLITIALFKMGIIHSDKITLMNFSTVNN